MISQLRYGEVLKEGYRLKNRTAKSREDNLNQKLNPQWPIRSLAKVGHWFHPFATEFIAAGIDWRVKFSTCRDRGLIFVPQCWSRILWGRSFPLVTGPGERQLQWLYLGGRLGTEESYELLEGHWFLHRPSCCLSRSGSVIGACANSQPPSRSGQLPESIASSPPWGNDLSEEQEASGFGILPPLDKAGNWTSVEKA